jgi:hypothetical protein
MQKKPLSSYQRLLPSFFLLLMSLRCDHWARNTMSVTCDVVCSIWCACNCKCFRNDSSFLIYKPSAGPFHCRRHKHTWMSSWQSSAELTDGDWEKTPSAHDFTNRTWFLITGGSDQLAFPAHCSHLHVHCPSPFSVGQIERSSSRRYQEGGALVGC